MRTAINPINQVDPAVRKSDVGSMRIPDDGGALVRSAVETVTDAAGCTVGLGVTIDGEIEHVIVAGAVQLRATG
jgi:hypothetical protein